MWFQVLESCELRIWGVGFRVEDVEDVEDVGCRVEG